MFLRRAREDQAANERRARRERTIVRLERLVGQMEATVAELKSLADQQAARVEGHGDA